MRGKRQLEFTCLGIVIKRLMNQLGLNLHDLATGANVPYTTLYDWSNGVIPNNPDQLKRLKDFFNTILDEKITVDHLLYGDNEDQKKLRQLIEEQKEIIRKLEHDNATKSSAISFMQWIIDESKKEKGIE